MKTVAELIEWYNKQNETHYHKITVSDPSHGGFASLKFTDVSNVIETNELVSFYGRPSDSNTARFIRINKGKIIYSEV